MYFGQTSNWLKILEAVTDNGHTSLPAVAAQYTDTNNAIRIHCGAEAQVQMRVQLYLTTQEDFERFDAFLQHFGLPRNGYTVVNTGLPYAYSATVNGIPEQTAMLAGPNGNRQP
jgi:hypothetical protein